MSHKQVPVTWSVPWISDGIGLAYGEKARGFNSGIIQVYMVKFVLTV